VLRRSWVGFLGGRRGGGTWRCPRTLVGASDDGDVR
jgi:hypothetical protein